MGALARIAIVLALVLTGPGCTAGILYQHSVVPLSVNRFATPAAGIEGESDVKHIQLSYLGVMWDNAALGAIAREKGMEELWYADLELLSVLTIWRQYTIHLYGR